MTRTEAEANYKAANEALTAFLPTEQKSFADYIAGNIEWKEREAIKAQHKALMKRFDEAFAAMASFPEEDDCQFELPF